MVIPRSTNGPSRRPGLVALAAALGVALGACRGGKTTDPAACMTQCEQECPYSPDGVGDNDEYMECLEACQGRCG